MVVLAASICTRGGKALLLRQFRDLSKDRITELLSNFPSLILQGSLQTTVEDESVRYVFQPLEEFYIVLITNKSSNILQDIDTLHLFGLAVSSLLRTVEEREVFDNAFELLSAFDEIINLGYKENTTLSQIQTFLSMESHEEKIHDIIERNKVVEANEEKKRKAKDIQRRELAMKEGRKIIDDLHSHGFQQPPVATYPTTSIESQYEEQASLLRQPVAPRGGGLQLGSKKPLQFKAPAAAAAGAAASARHLGSTTSPAAAPVQSPLPAPSVPKIPNNGILITITEKVNAQLSRDGAVLSLETKGDLQLRINKEELSRSKILLKKGTGVQYKPHPNVDKQLFNSQSIVGLKDSSKLFPLNDMGISVLKWRASGGKDDLSFVPLVFTVWVNADESGSAQVTLEYELNAQMAEQYAGLSIKSFKVLVPVSSDDIVLGDGDNVSYEIADYGVVFTVEVPLMDELAQGGSFEFTVGADEESLFPLQVQFEASSEESLAGDAEVALGKVSVLDVVSTSQDEDLLPFDVRYNVATEDYQVV